jgi:transposase
VIPAGVRIFVCTEAIDMRYGFDRLAALARLRVGQDPQEGGALFAFSNRGATRLKILWFDRNGYCLFYKRLHRSVFELPIPACGAISVSIDAAALAKLVCGVERVDRHRHRTRANIVRIDAHAGRRTVAPRASSLAKSDV